MSHPLTFIHQINQAVEGSNKSEILETIKRISKTPTPYSGIFLRESMTAIGMKFVLEKDGDEFVTFFLHRGFTTLPNLTPGQYSLVHSTGRCLWCAKLQAEDLFLDASSDHLALAASTDAVTVPCSKEESIFDGELILRIIPGFKTGSMQFQYVYRKE